MSHAQQSSTTFEDINQLIAAFLVQRDWDNLPARGIAISLSLEANELLEHYQWHDKPVGNKEDLADELADVFIYAFHFAQATDIDIAEAIRAKLDKADKKYPAEKFKDRTETEKHEAWLHSKRTYRKNTTL